MAEFTAEVFQNEFLPDGGTDVHAIVSVTCAGAGAAGQSGTAAEIIIIDTSGSMGQPSDKIRAARAGGQAAIDQILDGTLFAVIAGTDQARVLFPANSPTLVRMDGNTRMAAKLAIERLTPGGGTAIGRWIDLATRVFATAPSDQRHAILLTDGRDESERVEELQAAVQRAKTSFQCDCRGVGEQWMVNELRYVATELLGTVGLIANPADLAADFDAMIKTAMGRGVANAFLRVWAPQGASVQFVRQVAPAIDDITPRRQFVSDLIGQYPLGSWGDETRDYHVSVRVGAKGVGSEQLAARVQLVVNDAVVAQGLVKAIWSDDDALTTRINPQVAHYTGQAELADVIQQGLAAKAMGDDATATQKLGRAVQLAAATGNEEATKRLRKVVDIDDAATGTVRLNRNAAKLDEMELDTASTKTTRVDRSAGGT